MTKLASRGRHNVEGFDFCDGPHCQVFTGTREINQTFKQAVESAETAVRPDDR